MARLLTAGAETQDITGTSNYNFDGTGAGTILAVTTSVARSGAASYSCNSGGSNQPVLVRTSPAAGGNAVASTTYWFRAYMRFDNLPSSTVPILNPSVAKAAIELTSSGIFQLWNINDGVQVGSNCPNVTVSPGDGTWYRVELKLVFGATTLTSFEGSIDGNIFATSGAVSLGSLTGMATMDAGWTTAPGANLQCYVDDLAINDSTGGSQNSYPGAGRVVLLKPISDNAVGTGWTLGTGTAISGNSGAAAVDNTPPVGVADLAAGSDTKQIRNATSNANVNYDANLTTYTTAGIGVNDQINVLVPMVITAAPVTTSAKQGTIGVSSNPSIANIALSAGGTSGAFWSGTAAGTYATGWKSSYGTITYAPSVTLGNSPVLRITQVTSSTRIAMVCFMAMYVDYTPGAFGRTRSILQAVKRTASF